MSTPARSFRPLPPIPASARTVAPTENQETSRSGLIPPQSRCYGRWRESAISLASANSTQTVLPAYSIDSSTVSIVDLTRNETFPSPAHAASPSTTLEDDPPPYSDVPPHNAAAGPAVPDGVTSHEYQDVSGDGNPRLQQLQSNFVQYRLFLAKKGAPKPWATLRLTSRPPLPNSLGKAPRFIGGDSVKGVLELELDNTTSIHNLTLNIKGRLIVGNSEQLNYDKRDFVFLNHKHELYSKDTIGDPYQFGQCSVSRDRKYDGKMQGTYHFPFSFPFPTEVELGDGQDDIVSATYMLPPTFIQGSGVTVRYEIMLIVGYGKLRMNDRVGTNVVYVPKVIAPPASEKRQISYLEGTLLPGPGSDPAGWTSNTSITLMGSFQGRQTQVSCNLWLAKPLCYTRGTVLPCYLSISGVDFQLLDHLASPRLIDVRLLQYINYCGDVGPAARSPHQVTANEEETEAIQTAIWWKPPKSYEPEDSKVRWLEGEIHLPRDLLPSCDYRLFMVRYAVEMMPFMSGIFICDAEEDRQHPIVRQSVEIATFHEYGPIPTPFTTKHENERKVRRNRQSIRERKQSWIDMS